MFKNQSGQHLDISLINVADGSPITNGTFTLYFTGDDSVQIVSPQVPIHLGLGSWRWSPNQAETNHAHIGLVPISSVGAVPQTINIYPEVASLSSGSRSLVITVNDGTNTIQNALVRLTNGLESYAVYTGATGLASFSINDATWSVTITKANYTFTPTTLVVTANATQTYSMTAVSTTPSAAEFVTGQLLCYDENGTLEAGVEVELALYSAVDEGHVYSTDTRLATSDANGLVQFVNLVPGSTYMVRKGVQKSWGPIIGDNYRLLATSSQPWRRFTVPVSAVSTYDIPSIMGE